MRKMTSRQMAILLAAASFTTLGACDALSGLTGGGSDGGAVTASGGAAAAPGAGSAPGAAPAAPAAPALEANLANPRVGDVWVANLDHFSAAEFGEPGGADAYGFVQVVDVNDSQVTIITETSSAPDQSSAIDRLDDYQGAVAWDQQERIPVNRADFAALLRDQRILRTTRPTGGAAAGGGGTDYSAGGGGGAAAPAAPAPAAPGGGK